ncbi:MAG: hypothetical protein HY796_02410 [Elusimicrobia bacterium]|nr:hypothetical protein [Elusimicrobiota bacterium]
MKIKKTLVIIPTIVAIILIIFAILKVSSTRRGNNKNTDNAIIRPGEFHGNELDKKMDCILDNVDLLDFVSMSPKGCPMSQRLAFGIEVKFSFREKEEEQLQRFSLNAFSTAKRKILDEIMRRNPGYYWMEKDGVVNIQPYKSNADSPAVSPLDMTIPDFNVHKITVDLAVEYLVRIAIEHNIPVTTFLRELALQKGFPVPDSGKLKHPEYASPEEIINVVIPHQVSIRDCLNAIVSANPPAGWLAMKYREKIALKASSFKIYSYNNRPVPKNLLSLK